MAKLHRVCPTFQEAGYFHKQWWRLSHECHYHTINMYESGIFDSGRMANQNDAKFHTYMNVCVCRLHKRISNTAVLQATVRELVLHLSSRYQASYHVQHQ
jgi:hypothetical protein